jgi:serine/threonine protein kinase
MSQINPTSASFARQNLRSFTGQIRKKGKPVGTCFVINHKESLLVTSLSILKNISQGDIRPKMAVEVYLPQIVHENERLISANLWRFRPNCDIAILKITERVLPEEVKAATIASAQESLNKNHQMVSFGYYQNVHRSVRGMIQDAIRRDQQQRPDNPFLLQVPNLEAEMGGAPILDWERNLVVGMVSFHSKPDITLPANTAVALDLEQVAYVLGSDDLLFTGATFPIQEVPQIVRSDEASYAAPIIERSLESPLAPELHGEPHLSPNLPILYASLLADINRDSNDPNALITGIIGPPGIGKNFLMRQWLDLVQAQDPRPDAIFWWNFNYATGINNAGTSFLNGLQKYLQHSVLGNDIPKLHRANLAELISMVAERKRLIFILYGLEQLQIAEGDSYGLLHVAHQSFVDFLKLLSTFGFKSFCLISSTMPIIDFIDRSSYREYTIERLSTEQGRMLAKALNVEEQINDIGEMVTAWEGHTLSLSILFGMLAGQADQKNHTEKPQPAGDLQERVKRILRHYDKLINSNELQFLYLLSVFRIPVYLPSLTEILKRTTSQLSPLIKLSGEDLRKLVNGLLLKRLVQANSHEEYTMHPLIAAYFRDKFKTENTQQQSHAHLLAFGYYHLNIQHTNHQAWTQKDDLYKEAVYHLNQDRSTQHIEGQDNIRDIWDELESDHFEVIDNQYLLGKKIGSGGQGNVHKAYSINTRQYVAIKLLGNDHTQADVERFARATTILKDLNDPHILHLIGFNTQDRVKYIVMPLLQGGTLEKDLKERKEKADEAGNPQGCYYNIEDMVRLVYQIGEALEAAHSNQVVHRDVKPSNIVFNHLGRPYLVDFGLARTNVAIGDETRVAGTWRYMSPLLREGKEQPTFLSDQYALAMVARDMLVGLDEPINDAYPLEKVTVHKSIYRILRKALSHNPAERYKTVTEFITALDEAKTPANAKQYASLRVQNPMPGHFWVLTGAATSLILGVLFVGSLLTGFSIPQSLFQMIFGDSPTATETASPTATVTATETPTDTPTPAATATRTDTPSPTATVTQTDTATVTQTDTATRTDTPSPTHTETITPSVTNLPTRTASPTPSATNTDTPTATPDRFGTEPPEIVNSLSDLTYRGSRDECERFVFAYEYLTIRIEVEDQKFEFARYLIEDASAAIHVVYDDYCKRGDILDDQRVNNAFRLEMQRLDDAYRESIGG